MDKPRSKEGGGRPHPNPEAAFPASRDKTHQTTGIEISKPKPGFTWEQLDAIRDESGIGAVDDEGFTVADYAARYGCVYQTASGQLKKMTEEGKLVQGWKHISNNNGARRKVLCYRPKETE